MTVRTIIRDIIDKRAEDGSSTSPAHVEAIVRNEHADVFAEHGIELAAKAIRQTAREMLTSSARNKQEAFPGMELPQWFTVIDGEGDYSFVPLKAATLSDHDIDVEVKKTNADAAQRELRIAQQRSRRLRSVDGAHDDMLVIDAVAVLAA